MDLSEFNLAISTAFGGTAPCSSEVVALLFHHFELLRLWNRRLNLSSIRDDREIVLRHYAESLFLGLHLPKDVRSIADVGSGAGFPGLPVAFLRPEIKVSLIESHQRKAVFLREATRGVKNVRVFAGRADQVGESFDLLISRGVSARDLATLFPAIATRFAVLAGAEFFAETETLERIPLPWGERRFLHTGSMVPRGTLKR